MTTLIGAKWCIYYEPRDWWVGAYFGEHNIYICAIPTIVLRIRRKKRAT